MTMINSGMLSDNISTAIFHTNIPHKITAVLTQKFCFLLRETLLKKGSPSNSLPKTFGCFRVYGIGHMSYTIYAIILKVFGKGFGEEPFLRKVCPDNEQNFLCKNRRCFVRIILEE